MSSVSALTGGSGDVNPQALKVRATVSASTSAVGWYFATTSVAIPVQRLPSGSKAQVLEILKLDWNTSGCASAGGDAEYFSIALSTRSYGTSSISYKKADPYVLFFEMADTDAVAMDGGFMPGVTPTGNSGWYDSNTEDMTDGAGHGVLYGGDQLYLQIGIRTPSTASSVNAAEASLVIWYRWKNVGFNEYVGMVVTQ